MKLVAVPQLMMRISIAWAISEFLHEHPSKAKNIVCYTLP